MSTTKRRSSSWADNNGAAQHALHQTAAIVKIIKRPLVSACRWADRDSTIMAIVGFPGPEMERLAGCLSRLMPHVDRDEVAITGGVAIQLGLAAIGRRGSRATIADLDFVSKRLDSVAETVAGPFLVSHYHVPQPGVPKSIIQLVDPVTRIRVDIFPDLVGSLRHARRFTIGEESVNLLDLQSILDHKLLTVWHASQRGGTIDPKHDLDARTLGAIFGREVPTVPAGQLVKDVDGVEGDLLCRRCELSRTRGFPLAPRQRIFDLLGWSEQPNKHLQPSAARSGAAAAEM
jgi:hypothetical protein